MTQLTGLGSGLDIQGMVAGLRQATEGPTANRLNSKERDAQAEISGVGRLRSALQEFNDALENLKDKEQFLVRDVSASDDEAISVTATEEAPVGNFQVEVLALAQSQKLATGAFEGNANVGTGTLTLANETGDTFDVVIDENNQSLEKIRDAINQSSDNFGVTATVVNVSETESRLVFSSIEGGLDNQLTLSVADDDAGGVGGLLNGNSDDQGLSRLASGNLNELIAASDAAVMIDGLRIERSSNSLDDVIDGLNIDLNQAEVGKTIDISVTVDEEKINENINAFVTAYNKLDSQLDSLDSESGALNGDFILRQIGGGVRAAMSEASAGEAENSGGLFSIGVEVDRFGKVSVKQSRLTEALGSDLNTVSQLFAGDNGVANLISTKIDGYLDKEGLLNTREKSLNTILESVEDSRASLTRRMDMYEARMLNQLNAMDAIVAQMNSTGASLANGLASLPGYR